jgi:predicted GIY-YIG superfamily endonuclease
MEYIYRIHNTVDGKDYVGLTNNPKRRKNRHFTDLANNNHDNPHL